MSTADHTPEARIREIVDSWTEALRAKDVDRRTADYAPDVLIFDVVDQLQHAGLDSVRRRLAEWFATFDGGVTAQVRDLAVTASEEVAFCHLLNRFSGTLKAGGELDMWVRFTVCFRRTGDRWTVTHEHASAPFHVDSGAAALDLAP